MKYLWSLLAITFLSGVAFLVIFAGQPCAPVPPRSMNGAMVVWKILEERVMTLEHEVPFVNGSTYGIDQDHKAEWRTSVQDIPIDAYIAKDWQAAWRGDKVVIRTAWKEYHGVVIATNPFYKRALVKTEDPIIPGTSGAGCWLDEDTIVGIVQGIFGDPHFVIIEHPEVVSGE